MGDFQSLLDGLEYVMVVGGSLAAIHLYLSCGKNDRNKAYYIDEQANFHLRQIGNTLDDRISHIEQYESLCDGQQCYELTLARTTLRSVMCSQEQLSPKTQVDYVFDMCRKWRIAEEHLPENVDVL